MKKADGYYFRRKGGGFGSHKEKKVSLLQTAQTHSQLKKAGSGRDQQAGSPLYTQIQ